nr:hypothetical protein CFP56_09519 [Quercus suber]
MLQDPTQGITATFDLIHNCANNFPKVAYLRLALATRVTRLSHRSQVVGSVGLIWPHRRVSFAHFGRSAGMSAITLFLLSARYLPPKRAAHLTMLFRLMQTPANDCITTVPNHSPINSPWNPYTQKSSESILAVLSTCLRHRTDYSALDRKTCPMDSQDSRARCLVDSICLRFRKWTSKSCSTRPGCAVYNLPGQSLQRMRGQKPSFTPGGAGAPGARLARMVSPVLASRENGRIRASKSELGCLARRRDMDS